ncbi:hypothetical protein L3Q82_013700 [Scortum barcoo]|uniref:Uncharacterized protein n=1 Tax=Scortum barcoo TaxID=214431 RepID=A0ACB8W273_9TELE|nr:hypothetical protein L3Q82_013700 [Scortum barcoo]
MVSPVTLFQTGVHSLSQPSGRSFVSSSVPPSAYPPDHPESNGQTERLNQELETCLKCLVAQNQTTWSQRLTWVEYAHNSLPTVATGLSPFQVVYGYQPPLFPTNETEVTVPSAHAMVKKCRKIWAVARQMQMLLRNQSRMKAAANRHISQTSACLPSGPESLGGGGQCAGNLYFPELRVNPSYLHSVVC